MFKSFIMGGFECSTHRDNKGKRLDLIASTKHDLYAEQDYTRLMSLGIKTVRDGVRWHLIEKEPFKYDFSSLDNQISAVAATGIEIIWDYFHYGFPDGLDIFSPEFIERFSAFSSALTLYLSEHINKPLHICPINEISFFSWAAGEVGIFYPCAKKQGNLIKKQLLLAALSSIESILNVHSEANIIFTDPAIHIVSRDKSPYRIKAAEQQRLGQFEALDSIIINGSMSAKTSVNVAGVNYYSHNQWRYPSRRKIPRTHRDYRPFNDILLEFYDRYNIPILIAETGIEDDERPDWFRYVCEQTRQAMQNGVPVTGICLYPIANHPGWSDNRHCYNGLLDYPDENGEREIYKPLADEISRQMILFDNISKS